MNFKNLTLLFIFLTILCSCATSDTQKITYKVEKKLASKHPKNCKVQFSSRKVNLKRYLYNHIGEARIEKSFFNELPVMANEIHRLMETVKPKLCKLGVNFVSMNFKDLYPQSLILYVRHIRKEK